MEIAGKVIVVTGGAGGIGRALCHRFAREGARTVVVADVNETDAVAVAREVRGLAAVCDVGRETDILDVVNRNEQEAGLCHPDG